ncbi:MAG: ribosome recycling factor [Alphaproteobacteria bacterium]|nr:ribosome recycling factor [Alphaproteobacteria bacterium]
MSAINEIKADVEARMEKTIDALKRNFSGLRTGRASTSLLDAIHVEAYGSSVPLSQVGNVSVPESRMLSVQVWDKGLVKNVEKAIRDSNLGLNPMNDGTLIRIPIPPLSEERRLEMVKIAGKYAEEARVSVRNIRRDGMDEVKNMEKRSEISEDEKRDYEDVIQKSTDAMIARIDEHLKTKEQEIKQV